MDSLPILTISGYAGAEDKASGTAAVTARGTATGTAGSAGVSGTAGRWQNAQFPATLPSMGRDWSAYARKKTAEAFTPAGSALVSKYIGKSRMWQREEQRDAATIQRAYEKTGIEIPEEYKKQQGQSQGMEM